MGGGFLKTVLEGSVDRVIERDYKLNRRFISFTLVWPVGHRNAVEWQPTGVPYARRHGNAFIFQDDEAGARRARVLQDHLQFRRIHDSPMASEVLRPVSNRTFVIHTREK